MNRDVGATYREVLAVRDFRYVLIAETISVGGDQLSRVALSILVFYRTSSAALTGLTYGLTFLPTLLGSVFLAGLADHYPRRTIMSACSAVRAVLVAAVAIPGMPLWSVCLLVAGSTLFMGPFKSAQQALVPDLLRGRSYMLGMSLRTGLIQTAQLTGFALGGGLVYFLTPAGGLLVDSGTFLTAAGLILMTSARTVSPAIGDSALSLRGLAVGLSAFAQDKRLLVLSMIVALNLFHIVPEGVAAPYIAELNMGDWAVAVVQASAPLGAALGALLFGWLVPEQIQSKMVGPAAVGASVVLIPLFIPLGLTIALVLFVFAGALSSIYTMYAMAQVAQLAPVQHRGRVSGVSSAVLQTANGLGPMLGGLVAEASGAQSAIGLAGAASAVLAIGITFAWTRTLRSPAAREE